MNEDTAKTLLSTEFHGERIILSDSFTLNGGEYILLKILESEDGSITLKILGISGKNRGKTYLIPKSTLEEWEGDEESLEKELERYHKNSPSEKESSN